MPRPRPSRSSDSSASGRGSGGRVGLAEPRGYFRLSTRPLHILCFLLPLIALYEIGTYLYLTDHGRGVVETVSAQSILSHFFEIFGIASFYLPGIALATVLLLWHLLEGDRWRVYPGVLAGMLGESLVWTVPVLILGLLLLPGPTPAPNMATTDSLAAMSNASKITLSVGAGLYEELLFRLIMIAGLHFLLVDLGKLKNGLGYLIAAGASSVAFALYHDVTLTSGGVNTPLLAFYTLAGLFFAGLFIIRGFGIVVMVHTLYDVLVLVVIGSR